MPAIVAPTTAHATAPMPSAATAPIPGDPACAAFAGGADGFRLAGTRSLEIDLEPMLAVARAAAPTSAAPLAA